MIGVFVLCRFQVVLGELREKGRQWVARPENPTERKRRWRKTGMKMLTNESRKIAKGCFRIETGIILGG